MGESLQLSNNWNMQIPLGQPSNKVLIRVPLILIALRADGILEKTGR